MRCTLQREFGAFVTSVNDAGTSVYGLISDVPLDEKAAFAVISGTVFTG